MSALDCPITKEDWVDEIGGRNGILVLAAEHAAANGGSDTGPWEPAVQKIRAFRHLTEDWDGLGARAPAPELLASAVGLAHLFADRGVKPPDAVVPGVDGSVTLEWQDPDGTYTEVEVVRPLYAEAMRLEPGKPAKHWALPTE